MTSDYILMAAECALSPRRAQEEAEALFKIAPNPFEHGRINQMQMWMRGWKEAARGLIWC